MQNYLNSPACLRAVTDKYKDKECKEKYFELMEKANIKFCDAKDECIEILIAPYGEEHLDKLTKLLRKEERGKTRIKTIYDSRPDLYSKIWNKYKNRKDEFYPLMVAS